MRLLKSKNVKVGTGTQYYLSKDSLEIHCCEKTISTDRDTNLHVPVNK